MLPPPYINLGGKKEETWVDMVTRLNCPILVEVDAVVGEKG